jgi:hypothetical protein
MLTSGASVLESSAAVRLGSKITTAIADEVNELHCFIRHPQCPSPAGFRTVSPEDWDGISERWRENWDGAFNSCTAFGYMGATRETKSVSNTLRFRIISVSLELS